jgi:hypothetical protein
MIEKQIYQWAFLFFNFSPFAVINLCKVFEHLTQVDLDQDFVGLICNCLKARQSGTMYIYLEIYNCSIPLSFPVPEPQLDTFVVCKSRRFLGPFQLDGRQAVILVFF